MLQVKNICKSFGGAKAVNDISFSLNKGSITALLGVNGAGKSTLMRMLSGILKPDGGQILFDGKSYDCELSKLKHRIGYLSEDNPLYNDMYVREYLCYVAEIYSIDKTKADIFIEKLDLGEECKKKIGALSKGNRQRVGIAQAFMHEPDLIVLDEATSGLDPRQQENIRSILAEIGREKTILFSTHVLEEAKDMCSRFILIDKGQLLADKNIDDAESLTNIFHQLIDENSSR